jgi:hypothetical protein
MAWNRAPMKSSPSKRWSPHEQTVAARAGDNQDKNAARHTKAEINLSLVILTTFKNFPLTLLITPYRWRNHNRQSKKSYSAGEKPAIC